MTRFLALYCLALPCFAFAGDFSFREDADGAITLLESGRPVYTYNTGVMLKKGVPADRARCCYLHPLYTPKGVIVTDDFPADHFHHRGAFFAWPVVNINSKRHDLWLIKDIETRFVRVIEKNSKDGVLCIENGWFVGERKVAREETCIRVAGIAKNAWNLGIGFRLDAIETPLELVGDPTNKKGYGGFNVRFAPRHGHKPADRSPADTRIVTDKGVETRDTDMAPHSWASLEGDFEGGRASLRIDSGPSNPGAPNGWCLRHYGFLGVNFPGPDTPYRLEPGQPLQLRFQVTINDVTAAE